MARFDQQLVVARLVGDIGRNRILLEARLRRRQALPECGVGLGDQWIGAPGGGLTRVRTAVQGHNRHYAGTVQVTQRTREGSLRSHGNAAAGSIVRSPVAQANGSGPSELNCSTCSAAHEDSGSVPSTWVAKSAHGIHQAS